MKIFRNSCHVLKNLAFQCPNKSFSNNKFLCWIHFNVIYFQKPLKKIIVKFTTLINHILLGFLPFEIIFWNPLTMLITLLSFKGTTHAYLLNKSIAHNKHLILLLYLLNDCISAKSTPPILSLKDEWTFLPLNLLIICYYLPMKFVSKLMIWLYSNTTSTRFFI